MKMTKLERYAIVSYINNNMNLGYEACAQSILWHKIRK